MRATGKCVMFVTVLGAAVVKCLMLIGYWYLSKYEEIGFWKLLFGGVEITKSKYILNVVMQILPDFLFYHYVCGKYIRELKENYVYIFVREKSLKRWMRKISAICVFNILIYEVVTVVVLFCLGKGFHLNLIIQRGELLSILILQFMKLLIIVFFCNILLFKFNESVAVYANLFMQALPSFLVGVLYDAGGAWEIAVQCIPVNWCNYNYISTLHINPIIMIVLSVILVVVMYLYSEKDCILGGKSYD